MWEDVLIRRWRIHLVKEPAVCLSVNSISKSLLILLDDTSLPDITYDYTQGLWRCCGTIDGVTQCDDVTIDTFLAPAPGSMTIKYAVEAFESTSTAESTSTIASPATSLETSTEFQELRARGILVQRNSTANSTQPTSQNAAPGLSKRAIGGIAAGASVGFLLLVSALVFLFLCYRRPNRGTYREPEWQMQNADDYGPLAAGRRSSEVSNKDPSLHHADLEALSKISGGYDYNAVASHDPTVGRENYVLPSLHEERSEGTYVLPPIHEERFEGRYLLPPIHEERFEDAVELAA